MKRLPLKTVTKIRELRSAAGKLAGRIPALLILLGITNAVLPRVIYPEISWQQELLWVLPLLTAGLLLLPRFRFCVLLFAVIAGIASIYIHQRVTSASYLSLLDDCDRGAQIKVKIIDTSCCGRDIPWLPNPKLLTVKVLEVKLNASQVWRKTYGLAAVRLPQDCPPLAYGEIVTLDGTFRKVENSCLYQRNIVPADSSGQIRYGKLTILPIPGTRQFSDYLRSRGISRIFYCRDLQLNGSREAGLYAPVLAVRNFLLAKVTDGISSLKCRNLLATLFFGCRQGLDYDDKANYIKSGTIHIFTVSGLHVGILAVILFWLLRPLPFRLRHLLVPLLLLLYVLSTGMNPPATRAWLMIAIWCVCRALLLYIPALNIVFLSAALLVLKNPFYLRDMGFQFSFVVVGFLILSARNLKEWEMLSREALAWIPPQYRNALIRKFHRRGRRILLSLAGCAVAWLASSGISLYYQGIYFPFSIFANFLLIPFVLLLFVLVFIKLLFCWLGFMLPLMAFLVENMVEMIDGIAGISLGFFDSTNAAAPGVVGLLIFYFALLVLVTARGRAVFIAGFAGVTVMILFWHFNGTFAHASLTLLHGGDSQECALMIIDPGIEAAVIVNIPSYDAGQFVAARLRSRGIRQTDALIFSGSRKDFCGGAAAFLRSAETREIVQLVPDSRSRFFDEYLEALVARGAAFDSGKTAAENSELYEYEGSNLRIIGKNQAFDVAYHSWSLHIKAKVFAAGNGRRVVELIFNRRKAFRLELLNSSVLEIREYSFGW